MKPSSVYHRAISTSSQTCLPVENICYIFCILSFYLVFKLMNRTETIFYHCIVQLFDAINAINGVFFCAYI